MSKLKRYYTKGNSYLITVVTYKRNKILIDNFEKLWDVLTKMSNKHKVSNKAWAILPDHFHLIATPDDNVLDEFVHDLKLSFGSLYRKEKNQLSGRVWQSRFWDHIIRDDEDMNRHIDYIHYNPVKHRLVKSPFDWEHSSIHEYKEREYYEADWGVVEKYENEFGE